MVRTQTTVGTPVTPGIQAELGSLDRRRTARTGCYENDKINEKKKQKNSKTWPTFDQNRNQSFFAIVGPGCRMLYVLAK
jgi:hypothetical protein